MTSSPSGLSGVSDWTSFAGVHITGFAELLDNARRNIWRSAFGRKDSVFRPQYAALSGKLCIVTGANAGVGLEVSRALYAHGAHVVMACRSKERGLDAMKKIQASEIAQGCSPGKVELETLDLGSMNSVRDFARRMRSQKEPLSFLCLNAGIMRMSPNTRGATADGNEMHLQINHLGHWLLANDLVANEWRNRARSKEPSNPCRVVFVTSNVHEAGKLRFDDIQGQKHYNPLLRYGDSKLMNVVSGAELQRRMDLRRQKDAPSGSWPRDVACSCHPGILQTDLAMGFLQNTVVAAPLLVALSNLLLGTRESGARAVLYGATAPAEEVAGRYCAAERARRSWREGVRTDIQAGAKLWSTSCKLAGVPDPGPTGLVEL
mmetsp:Transcript_7599/g.21651  ORF Transcript_7599/g.21651 Transcript_7599/m.21651 type:complete len:376 (+) Transcript_7599:412-1539(+)|eukprot:CAMPEP_0117653228 /NCGR_PEP_ID=MMETSP0804-20121206/3073_1 /TAXON_ID=1074897 /ORGANISM="Tetraselmis astigmatica, Strain CCMP880" /LENGTH=375 /DNA_ID=CAMNT_0005459377 /DNA_START=383 /DNA_END=1510 /DNA_ORIENTATION=+